MPYYGEWGCFIHIPKTGGTFVRQVLNGIANPMRAPGKTHDLPKDWANHAPYWTSVRDPADWLASVWAHRERQAWRKYPHNVPWAFMTNILADRFKYRWPKFVERVTSPPFEGLVGWFFNVYTLPNVQTYRLGPDLYDKLRDIGGDPDYHGTNVNAGDNVPEISHDQRILIYNAEENSRWNTYTRYGFAPPTDGER